jgi:hypothetical protein
MLIKHKIILTSQKKIEMGKAHASASNWCIWRLLTYLESRDYIGIKVLHITGRITWPHELANER